MNSTPVTGYKISLKLFEDETSYFDNDYERLATQIYDHFQWALDILDNNNKHFDEDRFENLIRNNSMTREIIANIRNNKRKMEGKELGEYMNKNGLDAAMVEGLSYTFDMMFKSVTMASSFDIDTATIHITLTDIENSEDTNEFMERYGSMADYIKDQIIRDSLEDGIYEGCYDEGTGFDIYEKADLDVSAINRAFKRFNCLKTDARVTNPNMMLSVHCGLIDYRTTSNVIVEEIRGD